MSDVELITVAPGPKAVPGRVVLTEKDPQHPGGEVYLAAPNAGRPPREPIQVAKTPLVLAGLRDQTLVEAKSKRAAAKAHEESQAQEVLGGGAVINPAAATGATISTQDPGPVEGPGQPTNAPPAGGRTPARKSGGE